MARLTQMFWNFLHNVDKYTDRCGCLWLATRPH
jgi:hypothetical protein